jgi:hypothetical protein
MTLRDRTQALLDLVEADRNARCTELRDQANARARSALAQAHAQARAQMRQAFAEERQRTSARLAAAQAELQTRRRLAAQQRSQVLLERAWQALPQALLARWRDPGLRERWVQAALHGARSALPAGTWTVTYGAGWPAAERERLREEIAAHTGQPPRFVQDPAIEAGLCLAADGNRFDATLAGLLADREEIGGRLIGLMDALPPAPATEATG